MATKKFRCKVCGYIHEGNAAPDKCPVCQAPASEFEPVGEDKPAKKGLNKNSNAYILIFTTVIVVIVALLLSVTSGALKDRQNDNVKLDTKKQILSSLPAVDLTQGDAAETYANTIEHYYLLDAAGMVVRTLDPVIDFDVKADEGQLPLYVAKVDGATKYIIPLHGAGLWGAIWGYIALDDDKNTVYGVYFSHASETPGLGANIATPKFQQQFEGKHIMRDGVFASIGVMKAGQTADDQEQVDAISGGTITSKGVESMLKSCIGAYEPFLRQASAEETTNEEFGGKEI
ncbi:MAG: NADH:ubiquinone reductase (Na(+)-transporting) subunit C [Paludibacteraceae bacterium]